MAEDLDDGEFWLPSQFLTDDDILMDFTDHNRFDGKEALRHHQEGKKDAFDGLESFRLGFGSADPNSELTSPVESVNGSTGTESDEDSELLLLSGLTRQMARSTLADSFSLCDNKSSALSSSPQSTLCTVGRGSIGGCSGGSSRGSPTGPVSPPRTFKEYSQNDAALDLLYAAVGEVARMRMTRADEGTGFFDSTKREAHLSGSSLASRKPSSVSPLPIGRPHASAANYHGGFYPQPISHHQLQIQRLRQQQMIKQQRQGVWGQQQTQLKPIGMQHPRLGQNNEFVNGGGNNSSRGLSPSAWPPLQPRNPQPPVPGSVMRAGFLRSPGIKRESAGTGVFLPRRVGNPNPSSKKPEGSMRFITGSGSGSGSQRKNKSNRAQAGVAGVDIVAAAGKTDCGIQLPQEWTY